jgi:hypothetical protein
MSKTKPKQDDRCRACIQAEVDIEELEKKLEEVTVERDALLACRHGDQRCFECPDTSCCDNLKEKEPTDGTT